MISDSSPSPDASTPPRERFPLEELYPACFDWRKPKPLKIGIHRDIIADGHDRKRVRKALGAYCSRSGYQKAMKPGAARIDLSGQPAGVVTEWELELARMPPERGPKDGIDTADLPNDTPIPQENLVPGRLELTVKFSELPEPLAVRGGMKIGIHAEEAVVQAVLPPKAWRKLEQAAKNWPLWVAVLSGALDRHEGGTITLGNPALQVFERQKPKTAAPTA